MDRVEELMTEFCSIYGDEWTRENLTEEEHAEWVDALYEYYENEFDPAPCGVDVSPYQGREDYEIFSRLKTGFMWPYSLYDCPKWIIEFSPQESFIAGPYDIWYIQEDLPETMLPVEEY